jgi:hypothetical protein
MPYAPKWEQQESVREREADFVYMFTYKDSVPVLLGPSYKRGHYHNFIQWDDPYHISDLVHKVRIISFTTDERRLNLRNGVFYARTFQRKCT